MTPAPYEPGTVLAGKYRLESLLGQGGMGAVYAGENVDIGKRVAIKILLPQFASDADIVARFRMEARAAAAIGHPGIVDVIDMGTTPEGSAYLVMERLDGETLGARLRRVGAIELDLAAWVAGEMLDAIGAAHARGVVHRDLKPDNVYLVERPAAAVKLLDFGISKFRAAGDVSLTRTGVVMGTPAYMAPEQARGAKDVGPPADLYAVGAILYEMLAGCPAFHGESYNEILAKVLMEPHRPLAEVRPDAPAGIAALVDALLAKNPMDRPQDAAEARVRLLSAAEARSAVAPAVTLRPGPSSRPGFEPTALKLEPTPPPERVAPPPTSVPSAAAPAAAPLPMHAAATLQEPVVQAAVVAPPPRYAAERVGPGAASQRPRRWVKWALIALLIWGGCRVVRIARDALDGAARAVAAVTAAPPAIAISEGKDGDHVRVSFNGKPIVSIDAQPDAGVNVAIGPQDVVKMVNQETGGVVQAAEAGDVEVVLDATPASTRWRLGDTPLPCTGRCSVRQPRGSRATLTAHAPGHAESRLELVFDRPRELRLELARVVERSTVAPPRPPIPPAAPE